MFPLIHMPPAGRSSGLGSGSHCLPTVPERLHQPSRPAQTVHLQEKSRHSNHLSLPFSTQVTLSDIFQTFFSVNPSNHELLSIAIIIMLVTNGPIYRNWWAKWAYSVVWMRDFSICYVMGTAHTIRFYTILNTCKKLNAVPNPHQYIYSP